MTRRIVLVGASGVFGARLAAMVAAWPRVELVLAARRAGPLEALKASLTPTARATITVAILDRDDPAALAALKPFAVVDAAGPFQGSGYGLARAALAAGAHYLDLADGRAFVAGFEAALDAGAKAARRLAVTGASSTPALSHAALDRLTDGWTRIDRVSAAISPGAGAPWGLAAVRAVLSWTGRPVRVFEGGMWRQRPGWSGPVRLAFPSLGHRWASLVETPDLDLMPARFHTRDSALMRAGLEVGVVHLGLWLLSFLPRLGLVRSLEPLAEPLRRLAGLTTPFGSDRGGMVVEAKGADADGHPRHARWSLTAERGAGPNTPPAPAAAVLRALLDGSLTATGARVCAGLVTLEAITRELAHLPPHLAIATRIDVTRPEQPGLFPRLMHDFDALPDPVRRMHLGDKPITAHGRTTARGSPGPAALVRAILGLPRSGRLPAKVDITPTPDGGEAWARTFGTSCFRSYIAPLKGDPGAFEETTGPITFRFRTAPRRGGFAWVFDGWRIGPVPLPRWLGPKVRARTFARDGVYRFSVLVAHPLAGVVFAYAGRLEMTNP